MPELTAVRATLHSAEVTEAAGAALAGALKRGDSVCVFLQGELGAGKTTFVRGLLAGLGHTDRVPSPTYTLVEPYELAGRRLWHLDLYRLGDGAELEYLGLDEMTGPDNVLLIEWPERGSDYLPNEDLLVQLKVDPQGRALQISAHSEVGEALLSGFSAAGEERFKGT